uniref:Uncharacterized protein n=1 Tax=Candidatus Kentrum sp. TUN TaxID=2126343 RepID=A0A450Z9N2_9GAMM|nr:MAG: hypothetical protein BECKTUN1418E_GA0071001_100328 [Candidatus Kentron sp. TUN]VFK51717.1 MAG: hypothetical protein BECKTUN1418F_GA0071002_100328 [Candidatus Kentron sp. TUN]
MNLSPWLSLLKEPSCLTPFLFYFLYLVWYYLKTKPLIGAHDSLVDSLMDPQGRDRAIAKLTAPNRWRIFYQDSLNGLLARFDRWFGKGWFNPRALHVCYLLALGYSLLFVFIAWLFTGEGWIRELIFRPYMDGWERLWQGGLFIGGMALTGYVLSLFLNGSLENRIKAHLPRNWPPGLVTLITEIVKMVAFAGAFAVAFAGAVAFAFAFADTFAFASAFAGTFAFAVTGTGALILAVAFVFNLISERIKRNEIGFGVSSAYLLAGMGLALWGILAFDERWASVIPWKLAAGMPIWTTLIFLPTINAFFDVASLQVSRYFIGKIKQDNRHQNILWMAADVAVAIALLAGLYLTLFAALDVVDQWLFPETKFFTVERWKELFWDKKDWFHPDILWLTLMASTTLFVTFIHLSLAFAHLFMPLWHRKDKKNIAGLIREMKREAEGNADRKVSPAICRDLARAYYFPWEHGVVLGSLTLWGIGCVLHYLVLQG